MEWYLVFQGRSNCNFYIFDENKTFINETFIIQKISRRKFKIYELEIEEEDYQLLKKYFIAALSGGYNSKVINSLIIDTFTNVSIKLAINLIKNI